MTVRTGLGYKDSVIIYLTYLAFSWRWRNRLWLLRSLLFLVVFKNTIDKAEWVKCSFIGGEVIDDVAGARIPIGFGLVPRRIHEAVPVMIQPRTVRPFYVKSDAINNLQVQREKCLIGRYCLRISGVRIGEPKWYGVISGRNDRFVSSISKRLRGLQWYGPTLSRRRCHLYSYTEWLRRDAPGILHPYNRGGSIFRINRNFRNIDVCSIAYRQSILRESSHSLRDLGLYERLTGDDLGITSLIFAGICGGSRRIGALAHSSALSLHLDQSIALRNGAIILSLPRYTHGINSGIGRPLSLTALESIDEENQESSYYGDGFKTFFPWWSCIPCAILGLRLIRWGWWNLRDGKRIPVSEYAFYGGCICWLYGAGGILGRLVGF